MFAETQAADVHGAPHPSLEGVSTQYTERAISVHKYGYANSIISDDRFLDDSIKASRGSLGKLPGFGTLVCHKDLGFAAILVLRVPLASDAKPR
jgi:hypothetical protein